ncbi:MAG: DUF4373 domain-containing protein [Syntrophomonas sp.]
MARPIKEGMDYFPHDANASSDKKIEALRAIYGNDGYAFYFIMLEQIYQEPNFELVISDAETKEEMIQILSRKVAVTPERFIQILNTALKWECFDKELYEQKGILTSNGIKKRAGVVLEKRQRMRDRYHQDKEEISDAETTSETKEETPQSKVKKSKEKKRINYSLGIKEFRLRYSSEQLEIINRYFEILRTTRRSGTISESVIYGIYEDMNKYDPAIVQYACMRVVKKPELHDKRENYFAGILRNTTVSEALKGLQAGQRASPKTKAYESESGAGAKIV